MRISTQKTVDRAKQLRREMSLPEVLLWNQLRACPRGHRFRHQHPAGPFVLDFYCAKAGLCIEVDGVAHDMGQNPRNDEERDAWLAQKGIRTLRVLAVEILRDVEPVVMLIERECDARSARKGPLHRTSHGPPPPQMRGRI